MGGPSSATKKPSVPSCAGVSSRPAPRVAARRKSTRCGRSDERAAKAAACALPSSVEQRADDVDQRAAGPDQRRAEIEQARL